MEENARIAGLETDVKALTHTVGGLESDVKNVIRSMESLGDSVRLLTSKISNESKTNWSVLAAWASVIIGIISVLGLLALRPVEDAIAKIEHRTHNHALTESHPAAYERLRYLEKEINRIREEQSRRTDRVYGVKP